MKIKNLFQKHQFLLLTFLIAGVSFHCKEKKQTTETQTKSEEPQKSSTEDSESDLTSIEKEIRSIHSSELYQVNMSEYVKTNFPGMPAEDAARLTPLIYADKSGKIRKLEQNVESESGDGAYSLTALFNSSGNLIFMYFKESVIPEKYEYRGNIYYNAGKIIGLDTERKLAGKIKKDIQPEDIDMRQFPLFTTVKKLEKAFAISAPYRVNEWASEHAKPVAGMRGVITANSVTMREAGNKSSAPVGKLNAYDYVKILSVGKEETIGHWGKHNWYEIEFQGKKAWIFGAFIAYADIS